MSLSLSNYFVSYAAKRLTHVEVDPSSNQHEFQGVRSLREMFGDVERRGSEAFRATFIFLSDLLDASEEGTISWYDARRRAALEGRRRSEWHAYYPARIGLVQENAIAGDLLLIVRRRGEDGFLVIVATQGSTSERQLAWLFQLPHEISVEGIFGSLGTDGPALESLSDRLLERLGVFSDSQARVEGRLIEGLARSLVDGFPSTAQFFQAAVDAVSIDWVDDPDEGLLQLFDAEERLFRAIERLWAGEALRGAFETRTFDVDAVFSTVMSALQRRKSRAGLALENHLEQIFNGHGLRFTRGGVTENHARPDFVFPGIAQYRSARPEEFQYLSALGVKATAKDRWRQILAEAKRVSSKHLLTLEPAISVNQTDEMRSLGVVLVVPRPHLETFLPQQQEHLRTVSDFIGIVREQQLYWREA